MRIAIAESTPKKKKTRGTVIVTLMFGVTIFDPFGVPYVLTAWAIIVLLA